VKKEANLEAWLQKTAYDYKDYMQKRRQGEEKKTLRSKLAEYYQDMI
jgi:hypothetical protein